MTPATVSLTKYLGFFRQKQLRSVLDYGAGTLRNASYLAAAGFDVYAADVPAQVERIRALAARSRLAGVLATDDLEQSSLAVDLVLSSYVFNIIPDGTEKSRYLKNIVLNLRAGGYLLIEVRCRSAAVHCRDGCLTDHKCPHCIKTYSHQELDALLVPYGFAHICHYYRRHSVAVLYQELKG